MCALRTITGNSAVAPLYSTNTKNSTNLTSCGENVALQLRINAQPLAGVASVADLEVVGSVWRLQTVLAKVSQPSRFQFIYRAFSFVATCDFVSSHVHFQYKSMYILT